MAYIVVEKRKTALVTLTSQGVTKRLLFQQEKKLYFWKNKIFFNSKSSFSVALTCRSASLPLSEIMIKS